MGDKIIYKDKNLIKGVKQSLKEVKQGKSKKFKNKKEVRRFLDSI